MCSVQCAVCSVQCAVCSIIIHNTSTVALYGSLQNKFINYKFIIYNYLDLVLALPYTVVYINIIPA